MYKKIILKYLHALVIRIVKCSFFIVITFGIVPLHAQQGITVTGQVFDETKNSMPGVSVMIKGTTSGVISDDSGNFRIIVPEKESVLSFTIVGYVTKEIIVGSRTTINVTMQEDTQLLNEVIVVGYGSAKRRDIVGSLTRIGGNELTRVPITNVAQSLQGLSSGVMVSNPSGHPGRAPEIRVRGLNSINLSTDPLWIVDGMAIFTGNSERTDDGVKGVSVISMLNPNDIESIEILKDAAATAIYGSRAAGGVILVTTKSNKGKLTGMQLSYEGGISQLPFSQSDKFVDSKTWWKLMDIAQANAGNQPTTPDACMAIQFWGERPPMSREEAEATNTDQLNAITQQAIFHQVGLTANKGFDTGGVMFSFNYRNEDGLIRNNDLKRLTGRISFNFKPLHSVNMGITSNFIYLKTNGARSVQGKGDNGGWAQWPYTLPWYKIFDPNSQTGYWAANSGYNLRANTDRNLQRYDVDEYRNINNAFVQWDTPLAGLMIRGETGVDLLVTNNSFWRSSLLIPVAPYYSKAFEQSVTKTNVNYTAYANYNKSFGINNVDFTVGGEAFRDGSYTRYASGQGLQTVYPELRNPLVMTSMRGEQADGTYLMGFFARANYKLTDRYLLNVSARRDGHSAFSKENRWANFYAAGLGWIINEEDFMKNIKWLNLLKLRGSYGITGNTNVNRAMTYNQWGVDSQRIFGVNYLLAATTVGPLGSSSLKWETTSNLDLGFDYGLLKNRVNGSFAFYTQNISNLILSANVQPSVGYNTNQIWENVGKLKNWGIEFNVSSVNIQNADFSWRTDLNFSTNKNKVIALNAQEKGKGNLGTTDIRKEGEALGTYFLAENIGVDPEKGIYMIKQRDADVWNNEFKTVTTGVTLPMTANNVSNNKIIQSGKTPLPKFYGGMTNTFNYKSFDLNLMLVFAGGHYLLNNFNNMGDQMSSENNTIKDLAGNYWEKPGDHKKYPQLVAGESYFFDQNGNPSATRISMSNTGETTRYLDKGDYIRLKNLQLGYTLPKSVLMKMKIGLIRVYVGVSNLFTITGYTGLDPETRDDLPIPRTINFGLSLNL